MYIYQHCFLGIKNVYEAVFGGKHENTVIWKVIDLEKWKSGQYRMWSVCQSWYKGLIVDRKLYLFELNSTVGLMFGSHVYKSLKTLNLIGVGRVQYFIIIALFVYLVIPDWTA